MVLESRSTSPQIDIHWKLPHTLTILPTYRCSAACEQCCFQSNPRIQHRVSQDRLLAYIDQAREVGTIRLVCFSGGEAFLLGKDLVELVARCSDYGFMTRIVSNAYWAVNRERALLRLAPLVEAGLNEINFSTGDDHAQFVPVNNIINAISASLECGLGMALMIESRAAQRVTKSSILQLAAAEPEVFEILTNGQVPILESPWMQFVQLDGLILGNADRLVNAANVHLREPCKSVLSTVVVTPTEQLGMCCGLPRESIPDLHAGDLRNHTMKQLIQKSANDFIKIWLFIEGPEKMLAWAASKDPNIKWENRYAHNCDACRALYSDPRVMHAIEQNYSEKYDDILLQYALYLSDATDEP